MPSARAEDFRRAARRLGFDKARQTGSHERWKHPDGRATTIPVHGGRQIGPPLYYKILDQLGISESEFERLRQTRPPLRRIRLVEQPVFADAVLGGFLFKSPAPQPHI